MLKAIVEPFGLDRLCILTPNDIDANFEKAARNISNLQVTQAQTINLPDLLTSDYLILTKQGLAELEQTLELREQNYFRNRKISQPSAIEAWQAKHQNPYLRDIVEPITQNAEIENFNDELPLTLVTPSLKQYLTDLRNIQIKALKTAEAEERRARR